MCIHIDLGFTRRMSSPRRGSVRFACWRFLFMIMKEFISESIAQPPRWRRNSLFLFSDFVLLLSLVVILDREMDFSAYSLEICFIIFNAV